MMRATTILRTLTLAASVGLASCNTCRDGDIGSKNCLAERGGLGGPIGVVENVVWLPYKTIVTPLTGVVQGAVGWYGACGEPVTATLTLPIGAALGLVIGTGNVLGQEPFFVERDDNLFDVMWNPFVTDQEIYKYSTPPHARPRYAPPGPFGGVPQHYDDEGYSDMGTTPAAESYNRRFAR